MPFDDELTFEREVVKALIQYKWEPEVLKNKTEEDLIRNWAQILFDNNRSIDRLGDYPLTDGEMSQIIEQINGLRTPIKLNGFINGKTIRIRRDNPDDTAHLGKEVSLKIYDRLEIAAGQSRYQIVEQPIFKTAHPLANNRRGDLMLLINGMPVIHIELKKTNVPVSQACGQIKKYAREGVYSGLFSLVQVFVAMTPEETLYFANPGPDGVFNPSFYFHWEDFNNNVIGDWRRIVSDLLSIPMAHELIGFYTVADDTDGILKVMRSYQYFASSRIADATRMHRWDMPNQRGGYIWHTTGSGKTMTSYKSAQLIAASQDADKVVFLMDRIELGTQSLLEYRGFANEDEPVQATENTGVLLAKLKSTNSQDTLIVTSIQKMSRIKEDGVFNDVDIAKINKKRIVFIIDECHRSTFGDMLHDIKRTFPNALMFGFSGTPILDENRRADSTTADIFGNELHRYSIADGIRDKNVLGFDPYGIATFADSDLRLAVALDQAKAKSAEEAYGNEAKKAVFMHFMNASEVPMAGHDTEDGGYVRGIEDYIPTSQYEADGQPHHEAVVGDIVDKWTIRSVGGKFHAIFATSSIKEAVAYYHIFKEKAPHLNVFGLFDPTIDNDGGIDTEKKEDMLLEMLEDYNAKYGMSFGLFNFSEYKKDVSLRLAHKKPYSMIESDRSEQVDILIVVDQMLTGFDSKWVNTLYLDKLLKAQHIVQAFSRTNRVFGTNEKPHGIVCWYRKVHTMQRDVDAAFELYSGNRPFGIFVDRLEENVKRLDEIFQKIRDIFDNAGIPDFSKLPDDVSAKKMFSRLFNEFNRRLQAAKIQGFDWSKIRPMLEGEDMEGAIIVNFNHPEYLSLLQRYKELETPPGGGPGDDSVPYDIDSSIVENNGEAIDAEYMNTRFKKYIKTLQIDGESPEVVEQALRELSQSFALLSQEDQRFANVFLHDIQTGNVIVEEGKSLTDYIAEYKARTKEDQIHRCAAMFGLDEDLLREFSKSYITDENINEFNKFDRLVDSADKAKAKAYLEEFEGVRIPNHKVRMKLSALLRKFILVGGFDL